MRSSQRTIKIIHCWHQQSKQPFKGRNSFQGFHCWIFFVSENRWRQEVCEMWELWSQKMSATGTNTKKFYDILWPSMSCGLPNFIHIYIYILVRISPVSKNIKKTHVALPKKTQPPSQIVCRNWWLPLPWVGGRILAIHDYMIQCRHMTQQHIYDGRTPSASNSPNIIGGNNHPNSPLSVWHVVWKGSPHERLYHVGHFFSFAKHLNLRPNILWGSPNILRQKKHFWNKTSPISFNFRLPNLWAPSLSFVYFFLQITCESHVLPVSFLQGGL